jgi:hypothetical protein
MKNQEQRFYTGTNVLVTGRGIRAGWDPKGEMLKTIGKVGRVSNYHEGYLPYKVEFPNGKVWWYEEANLESAIEVGVDVILARKFEFANNRSGVTWLSQFEEFLGREGKVTEVSKEAVLVEYKDASFYFPINALDLARVWKRPEENECPVCGFDLSQPKPEFVIPWDELPSSVFAVTVDDDGDVNAQAFSDSDGWIEVVTDKSHLEAPNWLLKRPAEERIFMRPGYKPAVM